MNISEIDIAILVIGYSRPRLFEKAVKSLKFLGLPNNIHKYAVIDGSKKKEGELFKKNKAVKNIGKRLLNEGYLNSLKIRRKNLGTMSNVYRSITEILRKHDFIFVLEDDLEILPSAKDSIITMIRKLDGPINSFSIYCNYSYSDKIFSSHRFSSQAWGTTKKAWLNFNPYKIKEINLSFPEIINLRRKCGTDLYASFKAFKKGNLDSWAIPWNIYNFKNSNLMVYPPKSFILNNSHLIGGERTEGIQFKYQIAKNPLKKDNKKPEVNFRYLNNYSILKRFKRAIFAKIYKSKFKVFQRLEINKFLKLF